MFKKPSSEKPAGKLLLNKSERKKIDRIVKTAKRDDGIPRTAQQSIPFQRMFTDGICRVRDGYYTRTIQFQDINYQLSQQEDKTAIFEEWCSFLNFFDSSVRFELSFMNTATDAEDFERNIKIPPKRDGFDDVRAEYSQMLKTQLAQGNNGLTKTKYLTFGIEAASMRQAKPRLDHLQNDILNNFRRLGAAARVLNGEERLRLMHAMFHMDGESKFRFDWKQLPKSGLSVKDFIAPSAFAFNTRTFQVGGLYGAASFLNITASDLAELGLGKAAVRAVVSDRRSSIRSLDSSRAWTARSRISAFRSASCTWASSNSARIRVIASSILAKSSASFTERTVSAANRTEAAHTQDREMPVGRPSTYASIGRWMTSVSRIVRNPHAMEEERQI